MILLLTNRTDIHPNPVIEKISALGGDIFRLNTDDLLKANRISCFPNEGKWFIENIHTGRTITSEDVGAVWERRPSQPLTPRVNARNEFDELIEKEAAEFMRWFRYAIQDVAWIGHPIYDKWAASKMRQLQLASQLGAKTPRTYLGNKVEDFLKWTQKDNSFAVKPIDIDCLEVDDKEYCFFTRKIDSHQISTLPKNMFEMSINYIQEYVEKLRELRVTVVGDKVFTCVIDSQSMDEDKGQVDWRQGYDHDMKHYAIDTPAWVQKFCIEFLKHSNLSFGCFDFIETPLHEYVFLECNPNGQWMWIEEETGLKISDSIAQFLVNSDNAYS